MPAVSTAHVVCNGIRREQNTISFDLHTHLKAKRKEFCAEVIELTNLLNRFLILENYYYYYCYSYLIYTGHIAFLLLCSWRTYVQMYSVESILLIGKMFYKNRLHFWKCFAIWHDRRLPFPSIKISAQDMHAETPVIFYAQKQSF